MTVLAQDLRNSILQAAMQGKLTEQLESDSNVADLIANCKIDKQNAIDEGKYRNEKYRGAIPKDEHPYTIPENWEYVHISDMSLFQEGPGILAVDFRNSGVPLIRISGMKTDIVSLDGCNYLDEEMVKSKWEHFKLDIGDIVISSSASLDKIAEVDEKTEGAIVYTGLIRFKMYGGINKKYFKYFIQSPLYIQQINEQKKGGTIKHYGPTHLKKMIIPIPPIEEQKRIVEKLEEILPQIDEYEKTEMKLEVLKKEFPDDMKAAILQAAMQGKLTEQLESDSNVDEMLKKINATELHMIENRKCKKIAKLGIEDDDLPFEIPSNWKFVRLYELGTIYGGGTPKTSESEYYDNGDIAWITPADMSSKEIYISSGKKFITKKGLDNSSAQLFPKESVIISSRAPIGYISISENEATTSQGCKTFSSFRKDLVDTKFIYYVMKNRTSDMIKRATGTTFKEISGKGVGETIIPLPPIEEQKRIVEKLEQLLPLCDDLK